MAFLSGSRKARFAALAALYFAQGVPIGLLSIAVPAWLARHGHSVSEIAYFLSVVSLPWGFKLIAGPFMDRFSFPPMGRRRPWVMAAQAGLTLALTALIFVQNPSDHLLLLTSIGFVINVFSAVQDVAVDGMAIDVLPLSERGRANAFMAFGQVAGFSSFGALTGWLLAEFGLKAAAATSAISVAAIFVLITLTRERPGERMFPWTEGSPAPRATTPPQSFKAIVRDLMQVLFLPMSLLLTLAEFLVRVRDGIVVAIQPVIAVQELGFGEDQYSRVIGVVGFVTATLGIFFGPLIDRHGGKRLLVYSAATGAAVAVLLAVTRAWWHHTEYIVAMLFLGGMAGHVWFIGVIAIAMNICWERIAATQFAIYMSLANLSRSIGGLVFAIVADHLDWVDDLLIAGVLMLLAAAVVSRIDVTAHRERISVLDRALPTEV
jgi:PAT family beta-lactamase induction signal transducer AmpG